MSQDYVPRSDEGFDPWQKDLLTWLGVHGDEVGVDDGRVDGLTAVQTPWTTAYATHRTAQAAAQAAAATKDAARAAFVAKIREVIRIAQANPGTTDAHRQAMKVSARDTQPTPVGAPATQPVAVVKTPAPLQHLIEFRDANATGKAKPAGVMGAEIYVFIGPAEPASLSEYRLLGLDTHTPYLAQYDTAQAGQKAWYRLRWVTARQERGPWSEVVPATIAA